MDNVETLLQRFADDRDQLNEEELDALVEASGADEAFAARLKDQLVIDELLGQQMAVDRADFVAQIAQRIRDDQIPAEAENPGDMSIAQDMRQLLDVELAKQQHQAQRRRSSRWQWVAVCLLLFALAGGGLWWWNSAQQPLAVVEQVSGSPSLVRGAESIAIETNTKLHSGDEIATLPEEELTLRFEDGSELRIFGDTTLRVAEGDSGFGKHVDLSWGTVLAEIVPQTVGRPMTFETPLALATVRGTRLWLSGDQERTRLDVLEGVVDLKRLSDGETIPVGAREFALATPEELAVRPLSWPIDRRDAIVILETVDTTSDVRVESGAYETLELRPRGRARLDHNFALILTDGAFSLQNASAPLLQSCRRTNEITIEATISPRYAKQATPAGIASCSSSNNEYSFVLGQQADRLFCRLRTSDTPRDGEDEIELCRLEADQPQHVVVAYRAGELVCYLNGRRVYQDGRLKGDFSNWKRHPVVLGGGQRGQNDWAGHLQGLAIYDRYLDDNEVLRNAELYRRAMMRRPNVPQVEVQATLLEKSTVPTPEEIAPAQSALVVCRYRVDGVLQGELDEGEVLVAQWAVLNGNSMPLAKLEVGAQRKMTLERFGLNAQLEGYPRSDEFSHGDDPKKPRYYEVSDP